MKKDKILLSILIGLSMTDLAQAQGLRSPAGFVEIEPVITVWNWAVAKDSTLDLRWIPLVNKNLGIPLEVIVGAWGGGLRMTGTAGIQYMFGETAPEGLLVIADGGVTYTTVDQAWKPTANFDLGWRVLFENGFCFTPSVGYTIGGFALDVNLGVGIGY